MRTAFELRLKWGIRGQDVRGTSSSLDQGQRDTSSESLADNSNAFHAFREWLEREGAVRKQKQQTLSFIISQDVQRA